MEEKLNVIKYDIITLATRETKHSPQYMNQMHSDAELDGAGSAASPELHSASGSEEGN